MGVSHVWGGGGGYARLAVGEEDGVRVGGPAEGVHRAVHLWGRVGADEGGSMGEGHFPCVGGEMRVVMRVVVVRVCVEDRDGVIRVSEWVPMTLQAS